MRMPAVGVGVVRDFDERNATVDGASPQGLFTKRAETVQQSIDLVTQRLVAVAERECHQTDGHAVEAFSEIGRNDPGPVTLARPAPSVPAGVGAHFEFGWICGGSKNPCGVAAGTEPREAFRIRKNRLEC